MVYEIAAMQPEDYDAVRALWERAEGVSLDASDERANIHAYLRRNPGLSLVARSEGEIIGAVLCGHDGRRGYLSHLAVAAEHRRRGVGRLLVEKCLAGLREAGILRCNIRLFVDNHCGEAFWRRLGWRDRGELKVMTKETSTHQ